MRKINYKKFGFTLAEVLITLGVIGVVAAMTMPTVIKNYQKQVTVNKLKKAYTSLSNAVQMSKTVNGEVKDWDIKFDGKLQSTSDFADKYLIPYMKVVKACKTNKTGDCGIKVDSGGSNDANMTSFFTNDGVKYFAGNGYGNNGLITSSYIIYIDINGNNKPNKFGKDVFIFQISINKGILIANSVNSDKTTIDKYCSKNVGISCAAKIIKAGWKIEDDYPW